MRRGAFAVAVLALAAPLALLPVRAAAPAEATASRPWLDTNASAAARTRALLHAMSVDQKLQLIDGRPLPSGSSGFVGYIPGIPSLGVPTLYLADGPVGVANGATGVTALPSGISQAATFDPHLVEQVGRVEGAEQRAKGHDVALGPDLDVLRIPYAGRAFESFGEDPYLSASIGAANIRGVQSQGVVAVAKHFVANTQETARHSLNAVIPARAEAEIYEPPFQSAVNAGVGAVMCSYNRINGSYSCEDATSLAQTLEQAWRFRGFVVSDWGATHSTAFAAYAGLDMQMPGGTPDTTYFGTAMHHAVDNGTVSMSTVNEMAGRILWAMFSVGMFDGERPDPASATSSNVSTAGHRTIATRAAEAGAVLLKNDATLLPLSPSVHSVAVIGDATGANAVFGGGGSSSVIPTNPVTPLDGITRRAATADVTVTTAQGYSNYRALDQVPPDQFTPTVGGGNGWTATYYPTNHFTGTPLGIENVTSLDVTTPPPLVAHAKTWSVSYTATMLSPVDVTDEFALVAAHRSKLQVNGRMVIPFDPRSGSPATGLVGLKGGLPASIELDVVGSPASAAPIVDLTWARGEGGEWSAAAAAAKAADVAIVFASNYSAEGRDLTSLALPADQDQLINAVAQANPRTVVVLNTSSAVLMPWIHDVGAVLEMWYPGQQYGDAVAALLFGDASPSGHTPITFPASNEQGVAGPATVLRPARNYPGYQGTVEYAEGVHVGYRYFDATHERPLFPFGYGLAYTSFNYGAAHIASQSRRGDKVRIALTVTNTGPRPGTTVVQLYLSDPRAAHEPPYQLKRFERVTLPPSAHRDVTFTIDRRAMSYYRAATGHWTAAEGRYVATIGRNERDHATRVEWRYKPRHGAG